MNILYLTGHLEMGGTEKYTLNLAQAMVNNGHHVVWASANKGFLKNQIMKSNITLEKCELYRRNPLELLLAIFSLIQICRKHSIDIIHSADAYSTMIAVLTLKYISYSPKIVWSCVGVGSTTYSIMKRFFEKNIDQVIAVSHFIRNRLIEVGYNPNRIKVIYGSCSLKNLPTNIDQIRYQLGVKPNELVIGVVGRLVKLKGIETVILALPGILDKYPFVKLVIVGDGPELHYLIDLISRLNLEEHVIFTGVREDIENMYAAFDLVAFPTLFEAAGYIPLESMFYKKPIVASITGGVPELIINGFNGLLVTPADPEEWTIALNRIIENADSREEFVTNGFNLFQEKFSNEQTVRKMLAIYDILLGERQ
jgi:glycosyltransferase involved in cell wall biosynthesis